MAVRGAKKKHPLSKKYFIRIKLLGSELVNTDELPINRLRKIVRDAAIIEQEKLNTDLKNFIKP